MEEVTPAAKLDELEAAAKKATPGPWEIYKGQVCNKTLGFFVSTCSEPDQRDDADYIARLDPATVLWLVQRARRCEAAEALLREAAPCIGMKFAVHKQVYDYLEKLTP